MNPPRSIATWDTLKDFGFEADGGVLSDIMPGLSFDFGNFKLSASAVMGKTFKPVVLFTGWMRTPRAQREVCFELPRMVASRELLAAFLVYYLDQAASDGAFEPIHPAIWLAEGRNNQGLLPWRNAKKQT
jgi:hypothetical protein